MCFSTGVKWILPYFGATSGNSESWNYPESFELSASIMGQMTRLRHIVCVISVLVLLVAQLVDVATPESASDQSKNLVEPPKNKKSDSTAGGNGKGSGSRQSFDCILEDTECSKDKLGYEAIAGLHRLLDDDQNGNVDQSESDEFLRDELQYTDGFERHSLFHNNDKLISVNDLWKAWKFSEVYNWTVDDVIDWLQKEVDLPQYSTVFHDNNVNGPYLPRLATTNAFVTSVLGIKNPVHKQKLSLKAMDTVLFGAPHKRHSYVKDLVLVASLIFAVGGCWFAYLHHRYSQEQVRKMMIDLESLQKAEEALLDVQRRLVDAESRQISSDEYADGGLSKNGLTHGEDGWEYRGTRQMKEELAATRLALQHAEIQLESQCQWSAPGELQAWLQLTYELEQVHYSAKRQAAERQFLAAKESCDKIKRRNKAFFGSLRMAHSNSIDEIDQRILDARNALEEVKHDLQERLHRWHTMERMCGFPLITNPGLAALHQSLHGTSQGAAARLPVALVGSVSVEEGDEDLPPPAGYPPLQTVNSKNFLLQRVGMGSTGSLSHLSRTGVVPSAFPASHGAHNTSHSTLTSVHRGSQDDGGASPASGSVTGPVTFHLGEQQVLESRSAIMNYNQHHAYVTSTPRTTPQGMIGYTSGSGSGSHPPSASMSLTSGPSVTHSTSAVFSHSKSLNFSDSEDNLSQVTLDSIPRSQSSAVVRDRNTLSNGLDLVSHTQTGAADDSGLSLGGQKKPSRKKKLLGMFRKTPKQKPA